jgi:hypothetical protein
MYITFDGNWCSRYGDFRISGIQIYRGSIDFNRIDAKCNFGGIKEENEGKICRKVKIKNNE